MSRISSNIFLKRMLIRSLIATIIVFLSLRVFILGYGFFDYADQYWNPSPHLWSLVSLSTTFNGHYVGILAFTRLAVSYPAALLAFSLNNPVVANKIFIIFTFLLFVFVSYIAADLIFEMLKRHAGFSPTFLKRELFEGFIVIAFYSNIAIVNLNVDGGTWADGLIVLFIAISTVIIISDYDSVTSMVVPAGLMSLSLLLDPDYYLGFILIVVIAFFLKVRTLRFRALIYPFITVALSLPVLLYIISGMAITGNGMISSVAGRNIMDAFGNHNMTPISSLLLIGHYWSTYAIAPPSIIGLKSLSNLPSFGNIVLLPTAPITVFWIISISLFPLMSFYSLLYTKTRHIAIYISILYVISILMTQWFRIPFLSYLFLKLSGLPLVGPAIGTTLSEPGHYMNLEATEGILLISIFLSNVVMKRKVSLGSNTKRHLLAIYLISVLFVSYNIFYLLHISAVRIGEVYLVVLLAFVSVVAYLNIRDVEIFKRIGVARFIAILKAKKSKLIVAGIVLAIVLSGWQAFDGSFYPSRSFNGSPSGIPQYPYAPYQPVHIPNYVVREYSNLTALHPGEAWLFAPQMPNNIGTYGSFYPYFVYLMKNNYSFALPHLLRTINVKYLLTYDDSNSIMQFLNESPLQVERIGPGSFLYSVNKTYGKIYGANALFGYTGSSREYILAYAILPSFSINPIITNRANTTLGFNTFKERVDVLSAPYLASFSRMIKIATSNLAFSQNITFKTNHFGAAYGLSNDWYAYVKLIGTKVTISNGTFIWNQTRNNTVSLFYANVTAPGHYLMISVPNPFSNIVISKISFHYRMTKNFSGNLSASSTYFYHSNGRIYVSRSTLKDFSDSTSWKNGSFTYVYPKDTTFYEPHISINGSQGTVYIKDIVVSSKYVPSHKGSFDTPTKIVDSNISLPETGHLMLSLSGKGSVNHLPVDSNRSTVLTLQTKKITFSGNITLYYGLFLNKTSLVRVKGNYTVYNTFYSKADILVDGTNRYTPSPTLLNQNFYNVTYNRSMFIILKNEEIINFGLYFSLVYVYFLVLQPVISLKVIPRLKKRYR